MATSTPSQDIPTLACDVCGDSICFGKAKYPKGKCPRYIGNDEHKIYFCGGECASIYRKAIEPEPTLEKLQPYRQSSCGGGDCR